MHNILIIFLIISTSVSAQERQAKYILEQLKLNTEKYKNITMSFNFIFENASQNIYQKQKGVLISEQKKFKLQIGDQIIINNGETQWTYLKDVNEVQITNHIEGIMTPNDIFRIYEKGYKCNYTGELIEDNKELHTIDLFPEESNEFIKIQLRIDVQDIQLDKIIIFDKNGGVYSYIITSLTTNTIIKPFSFNPSSYPDIEVIDLR